MSEDGHVTIVALEVAGPDGKARRLLFSNADEPRVTSLAVVRVLGLAEGLQVDPRVLEADLSDEEPRQARERALRLLAHRERSPVELRRRLEHDGYPASVASAVVDRLTELDLANEQRFGEAWVRGRRLSGFGSRRIRRELVDRGVEASVAEALCASSHEEEVDRAVAAIGSRRPKDRRERERTMRRLMNKGFDLAIAREAMERTAEREPDD